MENKNKVKYSYEVERVYIRDTFYKDRSFLIDKFCDYRKEMNDKTANMEDLKERELEVFMSNGNKIEILEKKNGENWETEKFVENILGKKFEFEKEKENNNTDLTYTDAIYLSDFETKKNDEFSEIVKETGFKLAKFDNKEAENILDGIKDYERCYAGRQVFDMLETETLEDSLAIAENLRETRFEIIDNETGTSIKFEKGTDDELIFKANLKEGKDLQDFVDFYNFLKSKESFKSFENGKIKINSPEGKAMILNNGEEIRYSGKIKAVDKVLEKTAKELENYGFKKTKINGASSDLNNEKEQKNKNSLIR